MSAVRYRTALTLLTLLAYALHTYGLYHQSFWLDEVDAISLAREPIAAQLRKLTSIGENGPLYFLLFKGWLTLAGSTEFGARSLSALCATLLVPLTGATARRLLRHTPAALAAATLAATSPYLFWYGQDAKMYPLYALLALAAQYAFLRAWRIGDPRDPQTARGGGGPAGWRWWTAYVACSSLALYVHIFAALQIAANTAAGIWLWRRQPAGRRGFLLATLLLVGPYLPLAAWQGPVLLRGADVGYRPADLKTIVVALLEQFAWHLNPPPDRRWLLPLAGLALWGLWRARLRRRPGHGGSRGRPGYWQATVLLSIWLVVPVALTLLAQRSVPVFRDRYLVPLLVPLLMVLARAVAPPWPTAQVGGAVALAGAAFLGAGFVYGDVHRPPNPDFRGAALLVRQMATPEDQVGFLAEYAQRPFEFYFGPSNGRYVKVTLPYTNYPNLGVPDGLLAVARSLRGGRWLWVVRFEDWLWDSRGLVSQYLANRGARVVLQRDFWGVSVTRYEMP